MREKAKQLYIYIKNIFEKIFDKRNYKKRKKFKKIEQNFSTISIDSSNYLSELCLLGEKYGTDKSVYNSKSKHQHSYTPIYNILLNHLKNSDIRVAELGVAESASLKMFREFFKNAINSNNETLFKLGLNYLPGFKFKQIYRKLYKII